MSDKPKNHDDQPDLAAELGLDPRSLVLRNAEDRFCESSRKRDQEKRQRAEDIEHALSQRIQEVAEDMAEAHVPLPPEYYAATSEAEEDRVLDSVRAQRQAVLPTLLRQMQSELYDKYFPEWFGDVLATSPHVYIAEESYIRYCFASGRFTEALRVIDDNIGCRNTHLESYDADIDASAQKDLRLYRVLAECLTEFERGGLPVSAIAFLAPQIRYVAGKEQAIDPAALARNDVITIAELAMKLLRTYPHHDLCREQLHQLVLDVVREADEQYPDAAEIIHTVICRERQIAHAYQHPCRLMGPSALAGITRFLAES